MPCSHNAPDECLRCLVDRLARERDEALGGEQRLKVLLDRAYDERDEARAALLACCADYIQDVDARGPVEAWAAEYLAAASTPKKETTT